MRDFLIILACLLVSCNREPHYDTIIRNGTLYDGTGAEPVKADLAIRGDSIAAIGDLIHAQANTVIDATGLVVAPGFINMLSWAQEALIADGRSQSDIRQGVTLEVFGEGNSDGPLTPAMKDMRIRHEGDIKYAIPWTTLREFLDYLVGKGVSCNIASFIGATTVRVHEIGYADRPPTTDELERMKQLVRQAMDEGAVGLASSLIYPPAFYAGTAELTELARVVAGYDGLYISHLRSEGDQLLMGLDEFLQITRDAGVRSEIYHFKAAGPKNWPQLDSAVAMIEAARASGLKLTADMYTYTAAATGLGACFPPWSQEGGINKWIERLKDPVQRTRIAAEIGRPGKNWENFYDLSGNPGNILVVGFTPDSLKKYTGMTLAQVASMRRTSPIQTLVDLVVDNGNDVSSVFFLMSEKNIVRQLRLPWVSLGSDAESQAPEGVFLLSGTHPRAYGNFSRLLGKYVRDEKVLPLGEAIRRLTSLPAENLHIPRRGRLQSGYFADIVAFNPETIADRATYTEPHQYAAGMVHVFVNGRQVLRNGEHTGALPGRVVVRGNTGSRQ